MKIDMVVALPPYMPEVIIQVEIVDVAPHLASVMTFAVGPNPYCVMKWRMHHTKWRMHNVETGREVGGCARHTKRACIEAARNTLRTITVQKARAIMRKCAKESGL